MVASRPLGMTSLLAQQWSREAGGAAAAVDTEFGAGESAEIESGVAEPRVGFFVFGDGEQAIITEREHVAGERVALGGIDFDEVEVARFEKFDGFDSKPGKIDQGSVIIEQADERH